MPKNTLLKPAFLVWLVLISSAVTGAQTGAGPQPAPMPPPIAVPRDTPYSGTIRLNVDATDTNRRIFRVRETLPVRGGEPLTLLYPQWLPGNHSPAGRVD